MNIFHKVAKIIIIGLVVLFAIDVGFVLLMGKWRPQIETSDGIIILGAAINTPALKNRTLEGLRLYEEGKAEIMVLSGGKIADADISEAEYMVKVINKNTQDLVYHEIEDRSHNTYENIKFSKEILKDSESVIIVSDEFHLARAVLLAKRAGFEKVYWSAPEPSYYTAKDLRFYYFREFLAMINYIPKFIFG